MLKSEAWEWPVIIPLNVPLSLFLDFFIWRRLLEVRPLIGGSYNRLNAAVMWLTVSSIY